MKDDERVDEIRGLCDADAEVEVSETENDALRRGTRTSWSLVILATLGIVGAIYLGRAFLAPVLTAVLLAYLFVPVIRGFERLGASPRVGAGIVMCCLTAVAWVALVQFRAPAAAWMEELPRILREARPNFESLHEPLRQVTEAAESIEEFTGDGEPGKIEVVSKASGDLRQEIFSGVGDALVAMLITGYLLFFLLGDDDALLRSLVRVLPTLREKKIAVGVLRSIEREIGRYLGTITLINLTLGVAIGITMWFLGLPNPGLWGIFAALMNFVPYLGALVGAAVVGAVALATFQSPGEVIAPPALYLVLTSLEGMLLTPMILGRRLLLRPTVVFLWLVLWTGLWGIPGALLAIPLLVIVKIVCNHVPSLMPVSTLLGRDESEPEPSS